MVSIPLLFDQIGPNRFYGVRIPKAYESTELWYKVNRLGAKVFLAYRIAMVAVGVVLWLVSSRIGLEFAPLLIGNLLLTLVSFVHVLVACSRVS